MPTKRKSSTRSRVRKGAPNRSRATARGTPPLRDAPASWDGSVPRDQPRGTHSGKGHEDVVSPPSNLRAPIGTARSEAAARDDAVAWAQASARARRRGLH